MRFFPLFMAVSFLLAGLGFGALNPDEVSLDLYHWQLRLPLGMSLIGAALLGAAVAGGLLWLGVIWPLQRRLTGYRRAAFKAEAAMPAAPAPGDPDLLP